MSWETYVGSLVTGVGGRREGWMEESWKVTISSTVPVAQCVQLTDQVSVAACLHV